LKIPWWYAFVPRCHDFFTFLMSYSPIFTHQSLLANCRNQSLLLLTIVKSLLHACGKIAKVGTHFMTLIIPSHIVLLFLAIKLASLSCKIFNLIIDQTYDSFVISLKQRFLSDFWYSSNFIVWFVFIIPKLDPRAQTLSKSFCLWYIFIGYW